MNNPLPIFILAFIFPFSGYAEKKSNPDTLITYKTIGEIALKLHIFNPPNHEAIDRRPAIVFFFGGGWVKGTPSQFYPQCAYLASRGMVAISAEYRVASKHSATPQECLKDAKSAVRWIRGHAGELGVHPDMIAAGGGSAGGHLAAATALSQGFEEPDEGSISCKPNALVLFNPVFDNGPEGYGYERVKEYWRAFSPLHNINPNAPPTVIFLGTKDRLVPVATAKKYQALMLQNGARCELHVYQDQPHGFFNKTKYRETLRQTDLFLISLGYLREEPTLNISVEGLK